MFNPFFGDGYKIHVYLSHVIRKKIGFVANWASVDNDQFDRHRDTAAHTFVNGRGGTQQRRLQVRCDPSMVTVSLIHA